MPAQCKYMVTVYVDADGRDLCKSLNLPAYPHYQCESLAMRDSEMCKAHDAWASHWDDCE